VNTEADTCFDYVERRNSAIQFEIVW